jgi:hypothetical protein
MLASGDRRSASRFLYRPLPLTRSLVSLTISFIRFHRSSLSIAIALATCDLSLSFSPVWLIKPLPQGAAILCSTDEIFRPLVSLHRGTILGFGIKMEEGATHLEISKAEAPQ